MTNNATGREHARQAARHQRVQRESRRRLPGRSAGLAVLAVIAVTLAAFAYQRTAGDTDANNPASFGTPAFAGGPRLAVDQLIVDDGDVPYGHEVQAEYRLKNVGDQLLRIKNPKVITLDGC